MSVPANRRGRGRPRGGGNTAEQAKTALMNAAERCFVTRGYAASTMEAVAREAGYSRAVMYSHFPNRRSLIEALVQRSTLRQLALVATRVPEGASTLDILVEGLVITASELVDDPIIKTIAAKSEEGSVAFFMANDAGLAQMVEAVVVEMFAADRERFRPGLTPGDVAQFVISTAMTLLLKIVPGTTDPLLARRYVQTFILPAIIVDPPEPHPVSSSPR